MSCKYLEARSGTIGWPFQCGIHVSIAGKTCDFCFGCDDYAEYGQMTRENEADEEEIMSRCANLITYADEYKCKKHRFSGKTCIFCVDCHDFKADLDKNEQKSGNYEMVNHPEHYKKDGIPECWDIFEAANPKICMFWCMQTAYKYRYRAGTKPGEGSERDKNKQKSYENKAWELAVKHNFESDLCDFITEIEAKFKEFGL